MKFFKYTPRDFPEDSSDENGDYICLCIKCGNTFIGYKRRFLCRLCKNSEKDLKGDNNGLV